MLLWCALTAFADGIGLNTVVIDAGHGGKDSGAVSKDRKTFEKTITLDIATRLGTLISENCPDVKVVYTRTTDEFIELRERAEKANRSGANLFISVHINANDKTSPNGYSVHILGQSSQKNRDLFAYNMDVVKRENSVILLEDDYKTNYQGFDPSDPESYIFLQLMQNAYLEQSLDFAMIISEKLKGGPIKKDRGIDQNPFYVLWKTAMPAVLVELGFITNPDDLAQLTTQKGRADIAKRLFEAFRDYKALYDSSVKIGQGTGSEEKKEEAAINDAAPQASAPSSDGKVLYGTQIFASGKVLPASDPQFLGYEPIVITTGSLHKYIIGTSSSAEEARKFNEQIKKKYPASFMVKISDGTTSRFK